MQHRGKWVIATVFAIGVTVSLAAIWYLNRQSRQSLDFWGPDAARLIVQATEAELLQLVSSPAIPADDASGPLAEQVKIGGKTYRIVDRRDAIATRGFIHVRRALMTDATFDWPAATASDPPPWEYALRFIDGKQTATLAFAFDPPRTMRADSARIASTAPVAQGLERFFDEAFQTPAP